MFRVQFCPHHYVCDLSTFTSWFVTGVGGVCLPATASFECSWLLLPGRNHTETTRQTFRQGHRSSPLRHFRSCSCHCGTSVDPPSTSTSGTSVPHKVSCANTCRGGGSRRREGDAVPPSSVKPASPSVTRTVDYTTSPLDAGKTTPAYFHSSNESMRINFASAPQTLLLRPDGEVLMFCVRVAGCEQESSGRDTIAGLILAQWTLRPVLFCHRLRTCYAAKMRNAGGRRCGGRLILSLCVDVHTPSVLRQSCGVRDAQNCSASVRTRREKATAPPFSVTQHEMKQASGNHQSHTQPRLPNHEGNLVNQQENTSRGEDTVVPKLILRIERIHLLAVQSGMATSSTAAKPVDDSTTKAHDDATTTRTKYRSDGGAPLCKGFAKGARYQVQLLHKTEVCTTAELSCWDDHVIDFGNEALCVHVVPSSSAATITSTPLRDAATGTENSSLQTSLDDKLHWTLTQDGVSVAKFSLHWHKFSLVGATTPDDNTYRAYSIPFTYQPAARTAVLELSVALTRVTYEAGEALLPRMSVAPETAKMKINNNNSCCMPRVLPAVLPVAPDAIHACRSGCGTTPTMWAASRADSALESVHPSGKRDCRGTGEQPVGDSMRMDNDQSLCNSVNDVSSSAISGSSIMHNNSSNIINRNDAVNTNDVNYRVNIANNGIDTTSPLQLAPVVSVRPTQLVPTMLRATNMTTTTARNNTDNNNNNNKSITSLNRPAVCDDAWRMHPQPPPSGCPSKFHAIVSDVALAQGNDRVWTQWTGSPNSTSRACASCSSSSPVQLGVEELRAPVTCVPCTRCSHCSCRPDTPPPARPNTHPAHASPMPQLQSSTSSYSLMHCAEHNTAVTPQSTSTPRMSSSTACTHTARRYDASLHSPMPKRQAADNSSRISISRSSPVRSTLPHDCPRHACMNSSRTTATTTTTTADVSLPRQSCHSSLCRAHMISRRVACPITPLSSNIAPHVTHPAVTSPRSSVSALCCSTHGENEPTAWCVADTPSRIDMAHKQWHRSRHPLHPHDGSIIDSGSSCCRCCCCSSSSSLLREWMSWRDSCTVSSSGRSRQSGTPVRNARSERCDDRASSCRSLGSLHHRASTPLPTQKVAQEMQLKPYELTCAPFFSQSCLTA